METKKKVAVENPVAVASVTLIPVVRSLVNRWHSKNGVSFFASKEPVAVALVSPSTKKAFRITGEEITLDELIEEVPDIKQTLERLGVK